MPPSLLRRAGQAVILNALANWLTLIGGLLSIVLVARILTPADYGVYVMAIVAISIPEVITSGTLTDALVQRKDLRTGHINSVLLQSVVLAIFFWLVLILSASQIAQLFGNPDVAPVLIVCGVILPIGAVMSVPASLLQKELRYKEITLVDVSGTIIAGIMGVSLALLLRNEWALVGMELSRRLVRLVGFMFFAKWLPAFTSGWGDLKELARFNLINGVAKVIQAIEFALPKSLISATLGSAAVGVFNLGERLFDQMRVALIEPYAAVSLPVASMVQDDRLALHRTMENAIRMSAFLAYPTFIGAFVVAPLAIPIVFGSQWVESIPIFQVFMIIALRSPMTAIIAGVLRGIGRPDVIIWQTGISIVATLVFLLSVFQYGLFAIVLALLAKQVVNFVVSTWLIQKVVGFPIIKQLKAGATAFFASIIMGCVVWLAMTYLPTSGAPFLHLVVVILIGIAAYVLALFGFAPRLGIELLKAAKVLISGQPREAIGMVRTAIRKQQV